MNFGKKSDILLNAVTPLLLGCLVYWAGKSPFIPAPVRNYLPDGLWAYAFISCILIIWDRAISIGWITAVCLLSICFELLQYYHTIPGTGDLEDIFTYFLFFAIALRLNTFFKNLVLTPIQKNDNR